MLKNVSEAMICHYCRPVISDVEAALARIQSLENSTKVKMLLIFVQIYKKSCKNDFGVFRTEEFMREGLEKLKDLRERLKHAAFSR